MSKPMSMILDKNLEQLKKWSDEINKDIIPTYNELVTVVKTQHKDFSDMQARDFAFELIKNQRMGDRMNIQKSSKGKAVQLEGYVLADTGLQDQCEGLKRHALKLFETDKDTAIAQGATFDDGRVRDYREDVYSFGNKIANPNFGKELKPEWKRQLWFVVKYLDEYRPATMTLWREQAEQTGIVEISKFVSFKAIIKDETSSELKLNYSKGSTFMEADSTWDHTPEQIVSTSPYFEVYTIEEARKAVIDAYKTIKGTKKKWLNVCYWVKGTVYIPQNWNNLYDKERDRATRLLLPSEKDPNQVTLEDQIMMNIQPKILGTIGANSQVLVYGKFSYKETTPDQIAQGYVDRVYLDAYGMLSTLKVEEGEAIKYKDTLEKLHFSF
jgi:hypothetical protein